MTERPRSLKAAGPLCVEPMPPASIAQAAPARATSASRQWPRGLRHMPETIVSDRGRSVLAPVQGVVIAAHDVEPDHPAHRGFPSIGYALTQQRRAQAGWVALAGNHVFIESGGIVVALCHLVHGSVRVQPGQHVQVGDVLGQCGNSGNSTEPHVHVQAIDTADIARANAVRLTFNGLLPRNGDVIDATA